MTRVRVGLGSLPHMGVTHKRRCALLLAAAAVAHALSPQTDEDEMDAGGVDAPGGKCKYTSPDGYNFDLNGMKRTDHDYLGTTPGGYSYRFNVCAGTVKVCNRQSAPASKWRGSKCNNLGDSQTQARAKGLERRATPGAHTRSVRSRRSSR